MSAGRPLPTRAQRAAGAIASGLAAAGWVALSLRSPDATYHLGPLLTAAVWGGTRRAVDAQPGTIDAGRRAALGGLVVALAATTLLVVLGALDGTTLWGDRSVVPEAMAGALLGAALGFRFVTRRRPGLLFAR